ncbi:phosphoribosylanthranilate isomerase [Sphingorhabdus sp. Alg239-R122]|uniref:phosphoribosylanthranilate isomerase n=1 Tax=Sphingorhabdus sp. Alg239-R122 TaxID=2305989 RepID=UPI0013D916A0|nr:phosphoribosylanthranilate isomerase [Sphingorhabdus sp. Alg239-R122]
MTQIKICGLSSPETIEAAIDAGATHIGMVHFPDSARHVPFQKAAELCEIARGRAKVVQLLVNADTKTTGQAIDIVRPDIIQFHGRETPEWIDLVKKKTGLEVWKAVGLRDAGTLERNERFQGIADCILFDAPAKKLPGGNGEAADWSLLHDFQPGYAWGLAGGLSPDNIADAIRQTGTPLVDVSSGVESAPGVKDVDKIHAFCQAVQQL